MKAFLLAAGEGTRLRPLTYTIPKCLVPIAGVPLIHYWFLLFQRYGVDEVLINLHHLPEKVKEYFARVHYPQKVLFFHEPELLGSAGTVRANREFVQKEKEFFILYADNLTSIDLQAMLRFHQQKGSPFTVALFETSDPRGAGVVQLDKEGRIVRFQEKPIHPFSNIASAGIYLATQDLFNWIPNKQPCDFAWDVLPRLVGRMYGYPMQEPLLDVGTLENYQRAQDLGRKILRSYQPEAKRT